MAWNNPFDRARVIAACRTVAPRMERVLDLGCGSGELLHGLAPAEGLGVDLDVAAVATARGGAPVGLRFVAGDARAVPPEGTWDLVICLGSTHAFGDGDAALPAAAAALAAHVRPGGTVVVGEGFQRQPLPDGYRAVLGEPTGIERTHAGNVAALEAAAPLRVVHALTASEAEWDAFEWAHFRRRGNVAWRDAWLRWGRDTMGFGLYLAERIEASTSSKKSTVAASQPSGSA